MIDIKGDQSQSRTCYNIEIHEKKQGRVQRMTTNQIKRFDKVKYVEEEILKDGSDK